MVTYEIESNKTFLRCCNPDAIEVLELHSLYIYPVKKNHWHHDGIKVGMCNKYETLKIGDKEIRGADLQALIKDLYNSRLIVNREGLCYLAIQGVTMVPLDVEYYRLFDLFNWSNYGEESETRLNTRWWQRDVMDGRPLDVTQPTPRTSKEGHHDHDTELLKEKLREKERELEEEKRKYEEEVKDLRRKLEDELNGKGVKYRTLQELKEVVKGLKLKLEENVKCETLEELKEEVKGLKLKLKENVKCETLEELKEEVKGLKLKLEENVKCETLEELKEEVKGLKHKLEENVKCKTLEELKEEVKGLKLKLEENDKCETSKELKEEVKGLKLKLEENIKCETLEELKDEVKEVKHILKKWEEESKKNKEELEATKSENKELKEQLSVFNTEGTHEIFEYFRNVLERPVPVTFEIRTSVDYRGMTYAVNENYKEIFPLLPLRVEPLIAKIKLDCGQYNGIANEDLDFMNWRAVYVYHVENKNIFKLAYYCGNKFQITIGDGGDGSRSLYIPCHPDLLSTLFRFYACSIVGVGVRLGLFFN